MNAQTQDASAREHAFPRTYTIEVTPAGAHVAALKCVLLDPYHHIEMSFRVRADDPRAMVIEDVHATMERVPYPVCRKPLERVPLLNGVRVERGLRRRVTRAVGGPQGCVHLVDLFMEGVRLAIQAVVVVWTQHLPPDEAESLRRDVLGGVCIAYPP